MPILTIPKVLRERLTDEGVDEFIAILNEIEEGARKDSLVIAEERFERRLSEEASKLDKRITEEVSKLRVEMASFKTEIIKWMFIFWVGQLVVIAGLIKWLR